MAQVLSLDEDGWDGGGSQQDAILDLQEFVDEDLSTADVLGRIEEFVAEYLATLASGTLPTLDLVSRSKSNSFYQGIHGQAGVSVAVGKATQKRCMMSGQGSGAHAYVRVFMVMQSMHELLRTGRAATQRDLYYKLQRPPLFNAQRDVDTAVQDVVALLRVPRSSLGITCSSRGAMAGLLRVRDGPTSAWQDCTSVGSAGKSIPGDLSAIHAMTFQCTASYLLIIEKDAVFQRLVEDRLFDDLPCVMITAKGMPDMATRCLAARLVELFPGLVVLGLVDYNPHGVIILRTYKFGSHNMGLESHRYALPQLRWLGLLSSWLEDVHVDDLHPLTARDLSVLPGLRASLTEAAAAAAAAAGQAGSQPELEPVQPQPAATVAHVTRSLGCDARLAWSDDDEEEQEQRGGQEQEEQEEEDLVAAESDEQEVVGGDAASGGQGQLSGWLDELEAMEATGYKADIESLYSVVGYAGFKDLIVQAVMRQAHL